MKCPGHVKYRSAMGLEINHAQLGSKEGGGQLNHVQQYIAK